MDQYALKSELAEEFNVHMSSTSILNKVSKNVYVKTKPFVALRKLGFIIVHMPENWTIIKYFTGTYLCRI